MTQITKVQGETPDVLDRAAIAFVRTRRADQAEVRKR